MAKLVVATVVLVALLAVAQVSCFRTIVTTTIEEDIRQGQGESQQGCRQQIQQKYQQLQPCRQYMQQSSRPFALDMYTNQQHQQERQQLRQCCERLRDLGRCGCDAINEILREQLQEFGQGQGGQQGQGGEWGGQQGQGGSGEQGSQQGQQGQQQVQQILQKARDLPRQCSIRRECQIQTPSYY